MDSHPRSSGPLRWKRSLMVSLLLGLGALGAMPALAGAAHNDFFYDAIRINGRGTPLAGSFSHVHDNIGATVEPDDFPAGDYPWACGDVWYGANTWYWFFPHANGRVHVSLRTGAPAFTEPVVLMSRWTGTDASAEWDGGEVPCNGPIPGLNRAELPIEDYLPVGAGDWWAIEVAGKRTPNDETGTPDTGDYELVLTYDPDGDGDGLFDSEDECDGERGSGNPAHRGCPDTDNDGRRNLDDRCPGLFGIDTFLGCPDNDLDGIPEGGEDKCEGLRPRSVRRADETPRDGCPDILSLHTRVDFKRAHELLPGRSGIRLTTLSVTGVPLGASVVVTCKLPSGRRCGGGRVSNAAVRTLGFLRKVRRKLPFNSKITTRVTAEWATGATIHLTAKPSGTRKSCFYNEYGSKSLRKRKCP